MRLAGRLATLMLALQLFATWVLAQTHADQLSSDLERVALEEMKAADIPGAAIGIVSGGKIVLVKGLGVASVETDVPVTAETLFRLGSTTKMFTAAVLVHMALAGQIDFHRPIGEYVRGLDPTIAKVTVDQLLSHTAGLQNDDPPSNRSDESALGREIRLWKANRLFAMPGEVFAYSNIGYWLAGYVAETVAGKPYASVLEEEILKPLGMTSSTFHLDIASTYPLAQGHRGSAGNAVVVRPVPDNAAGWPSGGLFSSVDDLCRWLLAFTNDGQIDGKQALRQGTSAQLATPHADVPSTRTQYGYGLSLVERRGFKMLEHGGTRAGYGSFIRIVPERRLGIVVLTNRQGGRLPKTVERATELLLPLEPEKSVAPPEARHMTLAEMSEYVGIYSNGGEPVEIFIRDGGLFLRLGKSELQLSKIGDQRLMMKEPGASAPDELVMLPDKSGRIAYVQVGTGALKRQR
jgi:CubicO group peptidase (beta-lactamase class C family)